MQHSIPPDIEQLDTTRIHYPCEKPIHRLFEEQVERTPQAVAAVYEEQSLTYSELNRRANQLARYLREKGVGPDQLVGICVERGLVMLVGLLGILKAGGAYLPLDPSYPPERLAYMLNDASPRVLLTQARLAASLPQTTAEAIALDGAWSAIAQHSGENLEAHSLGLHTHHLAYVIYTSGSTGKPKGVMIEHRNVTRLFAATEDWFNFNDRDVWTLFHSFAFDFSVWELWGALLYGGHVVVVPHVTARSPQEFYRLVCEEGVTVLNQTPSAFAQLIEAQAQSVQEHCLRTVIFGGEALELRMLRPWVKQNGTQQTQLVNMYGITETTVHVTYRPLQAAEIESDSSSPIGQPIPDLQIHLLDQHHQPVPAGVAGELYVGGAGVARGYLNRPELTAMRFIANPFSTDSQARLYKTGDLGRWRTDGTLEYLGRNDTQVKIRGFRIELGEIEAQLARHPQVRSAVVLAREANAGEKYLAAYLIATQSPAESQECPNNTNSPVDPHLKRKLVPQLRDYLKETLPEYMIPSRWLLLNRMPLTHNGKLDRRALPEPEAPEGVGEYVAPATQIEHILVDIWKQVLGVDRLGTRDNFFDLGGHSFHAIKLIAKAAARLGVDLSVVDVLQYPSVEKMAKLIESGQAASEEPTTGDAAEYEEGVI